MAAQARQITVYLIKPSKYDDDGYVLRYRKGFLPSNTLACLAGLTEDIRRSKLLGNALHISVHLCDDTVERIDVSRIARSARHHGNRTIVCLAGVQTNQFPRAADLAFQFRAAGVEVLIGGFHVSGAIAMADALPDEIRSLLDAGVHVVAGEVEDRWGDILADVRDGTLKPMYNFLNEPPDLRHQPIPEINKRYLRHFITDNFGTIDCSRGCPFHCSFCTIINVQGRRMRCRDADVLIRAVRENYHRNGVSFYFFTDDNFSRNKNWDSIFDGLIQLREKEHIPLEFMMQVDVLSYRLTNFVAKARRAGCSQVFIGVESLNPRNLAAAEKSQNTVNDLANLVAAYHREDIMTHAAYVIGFPFDTPSSVADDVHRLASGLGVKQVSFFMLTPLPGSRDHQRMVQSGDVLDPDYNNYDAFHATMNHPLMTRAEWTGAYRDAWEEFYGFANMKEILRRTSPERYWNVFKNFLWSKGSFFIEHQHPMVAGFFRRKNRRERRPGMEVESFWRHWSWRAPEIWRKWVAWVDLFMEMEELWLQTRIRSERERIIIEEIERISTGARAWRALRAKELQLAYQGARARLSEVPAYAQKMARLPSQFTLFLAKANILSQQLTSTREDLHQFWVRTRDNLRHGRLHRLRPGRVILNFACDLVILVQFVIAMLSSGIR